jgi:putative hydroxymethylpyrimidine transport system ATP-binding protein
MTRKTYIQPPAVSISNLCIKYEQRLLFDNFGLQLPANKWTCLLGKSGIGKTSLLRFIAGLQKESEYSGTVISSDNQSLSGRITYMTQQDSLLPWLNALDNILIGFSLRGEKITNELKLMAESLLEKTHLIGISKLKLHQLSHGMRQRVAMVRALMEDRQIILMDEPFSALDMVTRLKLQDLAKDLLTNRTVLLVTHDPLEALKLGDYIYILKGSPAKIHHVIAPKKNATGAALFEQQEALLRLITEEEVAE